MNMNNTMEETWFQKRNKPDEMRIVRVELDFQEQDLEQHIAWWEKKMCTMENLE